MTVKALKKQLVAAIAMVIVSAIALSSSTYAWFASNNRVTATGMVVQATAEGGIEIAYVADSAPGAYATSASAGMSNAQVLYPTSTTATAGSDLITSDWYHASAAITSSSVARSGSYTVLSLNDDGMESGTNHYYFVRKKFNVRSVSAVKTATDLKVSKVEVTGNAQALSKALRVAIVNGDTKVIYAPVGYTKAASETGFSYNVATAVNGAGEATMGNDNVTVLYATEASAVIAAAVPATTGEDLNIYVWFEGEDTNHKSENLADTLDSLSLTVHFEANID
ncbi:MAG: hypothetical protein J6Z35_11140 [Lachnospiraceae bacterium]|nr:hypothetical protein [Lachnospiraceae bacterium]